MKQIYVLRSQRNVDESDATLAIRLQSSVGTDKTIGYCLTKKWVTLKNFNIKSSYKPCLIITDLSNSMNAVLIRNFIKNNNVAILNVAGHREEVMEGFSKRIMALLIESLEEILMNQY